MKTIRSLTLLLTLSCALLWGCQNTPQKTAVTSLTTIGLTANQAYEAYLSSVVTGSLPTNDVPKITGYYRDFQASYAVAATAAHFATNATLANPELVTALTRLTTAITIVKGK